MMIYFHKLAAAAQRKALILRRAEPGKTIMAISHGAQGHRLTAVDDIDRARLEGYGWGWEAIDFSTPAPQAAQRGGKGE